MTNYKAISLVLIITLISSSMASAEDKESFLSPLMNSPKKDGGILEYRFKVPKDLKLRHPETHADFKENSDVPTSVWVLSADYFFKKAEEKELRISIDHSGGILFDDFKIIEKKIGVWRDNLKFVSLERLKRSNFEVICLEKIYRHEKKAKSRYKYPNLSSTRWELGCDLKEIKKERSSVRVYAYLGSVPDDVTVREIEDTKAIVNSLIDTITFDEKYKGILKGDE